MIYLAIENRNTVLIIIFVQNGIKYKYINVPQIQLTLPQVFSQLTRPTPFNI